MAPNTPAHYHPQIIPLELRASSTPRVTLCPGSMMLPQFESTSAPARLGTAAHIICERIIYGQKLTLEGVAAYHNVPLDDLMPLMFSAKNLWEQAKTYFPSPRTEVELCSVLDIPTHGKENVNLTLTGHADIVSIPGDGTIRIGDWKSGWREGDYGAQLKTYALLAHQKYAATSEVPITRVIVSVLWIRDGVIDSTHYSTLELEEWENALIHTGKEALAGKLRTGDQCRYCPVSRCPAIQEKAALFLEPTASNEIVITNDNVEELHQMRKAFEKRLEAVDLAIKQFIGGAGPVAVSNDKFLFLKPVETEKITLNQATADVLLTEFNKAEIFDLCQVSKTTLLDAVRAKAPKGEKKAAAEHMMESLRSVGGVSISVSHQLQIGIPKEEAE